MHKFIYYHLFFLLSCPVLLSASVPSVKDILDKTYKVDMTGMDDNFGLYEGELYTYEIIDGDIFTMKRWDISQQKWLTSIQFISNEVDLFKILKFSSEKERLDFQESFKGELPPLRAKKEQERIKSLKKKYEPITHSLNDSYGIWKFIGKENEKHDIVKHFYHTLKSFPWLRCTSIEVNGIYVDAGRALRPMALDQMREFYILFNLDAKYLIKSINEDIERVDDVWINDAVSIDIFKDSGSQNSLFTDIWVYPRLYEPVVQIENHDIDFSGPRLSNGVRLNQSLKQFQALTSLQIREFVSELGYTIYKDGVKLDD